MCVIQVRGHVVVDDAVVQYCMRLQVAGSACQVSEQIIYIVQLYGGGWWLYGGGWWLNDLVTAWKCHVS